MLYQQNKGDIMNQRDATCNALISVLTDRDVNYEENGPTPISDVLNADDKTKVRAMLFIAFRKGDIDFKSPEKLSDDKYLKDYISGLVNNWIRKAPEFNCDTVYAAKNPGSRQGSGDEQIREMKKLLSVTTDAEAKEVIKSAIATRQAELKPTTVTVDITKIPEHLRALLGL
jgi:hypothetical protein